MTISFWSNVRGNGCVTSNMLIIGIMEALLFNRKSLLWENHCHLNNLDTMVRGWRSGQQLRERDLYETQKGMDYLLRCHHAGYAPRKSLDQMTEPLINQKLDYLSRSNQTPQLLDYNLSQVLPEVLSQMEEEYPLVIVDLGSEQSMTTNEILDRSDLVVVNFPQDKVAVDHFMNRYGNLRDKCVFLFGNYFLKSKWTYRNLLQSYRISQCRCSYIPHCPAFYDACAGGQMVPFLVSHLSADNADENFKFVRGAKMAAHMIERQIRKKELADAGTGNELDAEDEKIDSGLPGRNAL